MGLFWLTLANWLQPGKFSFLLFLPFWCPLSTGWTSYWVIPLQKMNETNLTENWENLRYHQTPFPSVSIKLQHLHAALFKVKVWLRLTSLVCHCVLASTYGSTHSHSPSGCVDCARLGGKILELEGRISALYQILKMERLIDTINTVQENSNHLQDTVSCPALTAVLRVYGTVLGQDLNSLSKRGRHSSHAPCKNSVRYPHRPLTCHWEICLTSSVFTTFLLWLATLSLVHFICPAYRQHFCWCAFSFK